VLAALLGDKQPAGQVQRNPAQVQRQSADEREAGDADDRQHGERDPHDGDVDVEVPRDAGSDSRHHPAAPRPPQRLPVPDARIALGCIVGVAGVKPVIGIAVHVC